MDAPFLFAAALVHDALLGWSVRSPFHFLRGCKMNAVHTVVGIDVAKNVFQAYWVVPETGEIRNVQIKRARFLENFAGRPRCLIGMEACGGAQHWARELGKLGHEVVLLPAKAVKAYVSGNKSDAIDARAIWMAVRQGGVKRVAVKSEAQQAVLALHRMRQQLVKVRTAQSNALRGLLTEYGEVFAQGRAALTQGIAEALERLEQRLPRVVVDSLGELWARVTEIDGQVKQIERRLTSLLAEDRNAQRILQVPASDCLPRRQSVPPWDTRARPNRAANSLRGLDWCRHTREPAARRGCSESANAATAMCGRCSSTVLAAYSPAARVQGLGFRTSARGVR